MEQYITIPVRNNGQAIGYLKASWKKYVPFCFLQGDLPVEFDNEYSATVFLNEHWEKLQLEVAKIKIGNIYNLKLTLTGPVVTALKLTSFETNYNNTVFRCNFIQLNNPKITSSYAVMVMVCGTALQITNTLKYQYLFLQEDLNIEIVDDLKQICLFPKQEIDLDIDIAERVRRNEELLERYVYKEKSEKLVYECRKKRDTQSKIDEILQAFKDDYGEGCTPTQREVAFYTGQTLRNVQRYYAGDVSNRFYHGHVRELRGYGAGGIL